MAHISFNLKDLGGAASKLPPRDIPFGIPSGKCPGISVMVSNTKKISPD
jgi:hypothetical protein